MKLLLVISVIAYGYSEKLDRSYLPPINAASSGGSPGSLSAPFGLPNGPSGIDSDTKSTGFGQSSGSSRLGQTGATFGQTSLTNAANLGSGGFGSSTGPVGSKTSVFGQNSGTFSQLAPTGSGQGIDGFASKPAFGSGTGNGQTSQSVLTQTSSLNQRGPVSQRAQSDAERNAEILRYDNQNDGEMFSYSFETSNGISAEESGVATNGVRAQGGFSYTSDDGEKITVTYTADENGFQPRGDHLPTPPPIPAEILKSIEENARAAAAGIQEGAYRSEENEPGVSNQLNYGKSTTSNQFKGLKQQYGIPGQGIQDAQPGLDIGNGYQQQGLSPKGQTTVSRGQGVFGQTTESQGQGVFGQTTGSQGKGVFGQTGESQGQGVFGQTTGSQGQGSFGQNTGSQGKGIFGQTGGLQGQGVFGQTTGSQGQGSFGQTTGSQGKGVFGQTGGLQGQGVFGQTTGSQGKGVFGQNTGSQGQGVFGQTTGSQGKGVFGQSGGSQGNGVFGQSGGAQGQGSFGQTTGSQGQGVFGQTTGSQGKGVFGQTDGSQGLGAFGQTAESKGQGIIGPTTGLQGQGGLGQKFATKGRGQINQGNIQGQQDYSQDIGFSAQKIDGARGQGLNSQGNQFNKQGPTNGFNKLSSPSQRFSGQLSSQGLKETGYEYNRPQGSSFPSGDNRPGKGSSPLGGTQYRPNVQQPSIQSGLGSNQPSYPGPNRPSAILGSTGQDSKYRPNGNQSPTGSTTSSSDQVPGFQPNTNQPAFGSTNNNLGQGLGYKPDSNQPGSGPTSGRFFSQNQPGGNAPSFTGSGQGAPFNKPDGNQSSDLAGQGYNYNRPGSQPNKPANESQRPGFAATPTSNQANSGQTFGGPRQPPSFSPEEGYKY